MAWYDLKPFTPGQPARGRDRWDRAVRGVREAALLSWRWHARRPRPRGITVSLTGRCDLRCRHCERGTPDPAPAELPLETVLRLVDLAGDLQVGLLLTGGEPGLHPGLREILELAGRRGVRVELNTNGHALADADAGLIRRLNATVELLRVSLDSADPAEHDAWRGVVGSQAQAWRLLRDPRLTCRREISAVLALDLHNAVPLLELAREARCAVTFQPLIFGTNFPALPRRAWKAAQQGEMPRLAASVPAVLSDLRREAKRRCVRTNLATLQVILGAYYRESWGPAYYQERVVPRFRCVIPYQRLTVDEQGRLAPCVFLPGSEPIHDGDVLRQWEALATAYRRGDAPRVRLAPCRSCSCYFVENQRASAILDPVTNRQTLLALWRA